MLVLIRRCCFRSHIAVVVVYYHLRQKSSILLVAPADIVVAEWAVQVDRRTGLVELAGLAPFVGLEADSLRKVEVEIVVVVDQCGRSSLVVGLCIVAVANTDPDIGFVNVLVVQGTVIVSAIEVLEKEVVVVVVGTLAGVVVGLANSGCMSRSVVAQIVRMHQNSDRAVDVVAVGMVAAAAAASSDHSLDPDHPVFVPLHIG